MNGNRVPQDQLLNEYRRLRTAAIERTFIQVAIDVHEILVLDGIDQIPDLPGFRIRSRDLYGPLPDILVKDTGDRYPVLDRIENEAAKLIAVVRERQNISGIFPGCRFLLPTSTHEGVLVGIRFRGRTIFAEATSAWQAYHQLTRNAVSEILS